MQSTWEEEQLQLKSQLVTHDMHEWDLESIRRVGGVDISFVKSNNVDAVASLVVCEYPSLDVIYESISPIKLTEEYIPGFLAFRECPHLETLLNNCPSDHYPDCVIVDGNGILHPRGFGLASHLGVKQDIPTVGVGKNFFVMDGMDRDQIKAQARATFNEGKTSLPLIGESGNIWGAAVRSTSDCIDPVFVSIGHRVSLDTAVQLVRNCARHRVPEPVRQADLRSREYVRQYM